MSKILKFIDIYGEELKFKIDNKESIQSISGGILTLATCFIVVLVAYFLGQDVFYRQLPISSTENSRFEIAPNITLDKTNYPLTFGLVDINNYPFYNESLLTINAYKYTTKMNSDGLSNLTRTPLPIEKCKLESFPDKTDKRIVSTLLNYKCISNQSINLQGYWTSQQMEAIVIEFNRCNNLTSKVKCANDQEFTEFLIKNGTSGNLLTIENIVSITNYKNPLSQYLSVDYRFILNDTVKIINYMISNNTLLTDSGFFTPSIEEKNFYKFLLFLLILQKLLVIIYLY